MIVPFPPPDIDASIVMPASVYVVAGDLDRRARFIVAAAAPAAAATAPVLRRYGNASPTAEETGDDHIPLPGPIVTNLAAHLPAEGEAGPVKFRNTLRSALPPWFRPHAEEVTTQWPAATWLPSLGAIAQTNGGHRADNFQATIYAFLRCLMFQARNYTRRLYMENEVAANTAPGDQGPEDIGSAMHNYNGTVRRDGNLGLGPEMVVLATRFSSDNGITMMNPRMLHGGQSQLLEPGKGLNFGGYGIAVQVPKLKGVFVSDSRDGRMAFVSFDQERRKGYTLVASLVDQWYSGKLIVDEERDLVIGINGSDYGKRVLYVKVARISDYEKALQPGGNPSTVPVTRIEVKVADPRVTALNWEMDRTGLKYLRGCGFIGVKRISPTEAVFIRMTWNDPKDWRKGASIGVWTPANGVNPPALMNDVYGSLIVEDNPVPDLMPGLKLVMFLTGPDSDPFVARPPVIE